MKRYFIFLPIIFFALIQGAFLSLNWVLLIVLIWLILRPEKESLLLVFLSGLLLDLSRGNPLGLSSLLFLGFGGLLLLYRRKFNPLHPVFLAFLMFTSAGLYGLVINRFFNWQEGLVLAVFALGVRSVVNFLSPDFGHQGIRLKV